jgi:hypothetical protein
MPLAEPNGVRHQIPPVRRIMKCLREMEANWEATRQNTHLQPAGRWHPREALMLVEGVVEWGRRSW